MKINHVKVGTAVHGPQKHAETYVKEGDPRLGKYEETFEFPPGTIQEVTFDEDGNYQQIVKNNNNIVFTETTTFIGDNKIEQLITKGDVTMKITTSIDEDGNITVTHVKVD